MNGQEEREQQKSIVLELHLKKKLSATCIYVPNHNYYTKIHNLRK